MVLKIFSIYDIKSEVFFRLLFYDGGWRGCSCL